MGCIFSASKDINDTHPNIFVVHNIDDNNKKVSGGHLEVTETSVILHQRGKNPVVWPFRCLRRYGAEEDTFSFESGRKCLTGPGIYAFRCKRAGKLLALLQERVRKSSGFHCHPSWSDLGQLTTNDIREDENNMATNVTPLRSASPNMHVVTLPCTMSNDSVLGVVADSQNQPEYANIILTRDKKSEEASDGYLVPNTPIAMTFNVDMFRESHEYQNVNINNHHLDSVSGAPSLPPKPTQGISKPNSSTPVFSVDSRINYSNGDPEESVQMNYISVEFVETPTPKSNCVDESSNVKAMPNLSVENLFQDDEGDRVLPAEYTVIDIERTKALCNTVKNRSSGGSKKTGSLLDSPAGVRKTRHNSSLSELTKVGLPSSKQKRNSVDDAWQ